VYWINKFSRFPNAAGRVLDRRKVDGVVREEEERGPQKGPLGAKRGGVTLRPSLGEKSYDISAILTTYYQNNPYKSHVVSFVSKS